VHTARFPCPGLEQAFTHLPEWRIRNAGNDRSTYATFPRLSLTLSSNRDITSTYLFLFSEGGRGVENSSSTQLS